LISVAAAVIDDWRSVAALATCAFSFFSSSARLA
jgi:hypothetical protein